MVTVTPTKPGKVPIRHEKDRKSEEQLFLPPSTVFLLDPHLGHPQLTVNMGAQKPQQGAQQPLHDALPCCSGHFHPKIDLTVPREDEWHDLVLKLFLLLQPISLPQQALLSQ